MGQKTHPIGFRVGISRTWSSRWYKNRDYAKLLHEDFKIRSFLKKELKSAGISKVDIERAASKAKVNVYSSRPGLIIGKKGSDVDQLRDKVQKISKSDVVLNILEVRKPEIDATLVAESIANQLERRIAFRRAMKKAMATAIKMGVKGIKIKISGRLGGADIARTEGYAEGSIPLHTLKSEIDYGVATAATTHGQIGIKVWVYRRDVPTRKSVTSTDRGSKSAGSSQVLDVR